MGAGGDRRRSRDRSSSRSLADYRDQMREIVRQGLVDIMLMSVSTSEVLTVKERLFEDSAVTPAVRVNDSTDIHLMAAAAPTPRSRRCRSQPRRSPQAVRAGGVGPRPLLDHAEQRRDARPRDAPGLPHVSPRGRAAGAAPLPRGLRPQRARRPPAGGRWTIPQRARSRGRWPACPAALGRCSSSCRTTDRGRWRSWWLRPASGAGSARRRLRHHPRRLPPAGGGARHGARAALFGRKINASEHQLTFVRYLRADRRRRPRRRGRCSRLPRRPRPAGDQATFAAR